jgi:hypothetical protein
VATILIWSSSIALETVILLRGAFNGLLKRYLLFFTYLACVLVKEIVGLLIYQFANDSYSVSYWPAELITILASSLVILEIFKSATRHKPGIRRLTQTALLAVFAFTLSYAATDFAHDHSITLSRVIADLGRDFRYVEAGILLAMLWLLSRYRLPLSRNALGIMIGYSFYLALNVVNLAFWFQDGNAFSVLLRGMLPLTYVITLGIWCLALWSPYPEPVQPSETRIERDYEVLAAKTRLALGRLLARLFGIDNP